MQMIALISIFCHKSKTTIINILLLIQSKIKITP